MAEQKPLSMNTTTITGAIHTIFPHEKYGDFRKRVFWVKEVNVKHPNIWSLEAWHDDTDNLDKLKGYVGEVSCEVTIRGKMYSKNGRDGIINTLHCTGIKKI